MKRYELKRYEIYYDSGFYWEYRDDRESLTLYDGNDRDIGVITVVEGLFRWRTLRDQEDGVCLTMEEAMERVESRALRKVLVIWEHDQYRWD